MNGLRLRICRKCEIAYEEKTEYEQDKSVHCVQEYYR